MKKKKSPAPVTEAVDAEAMDRICAALAAVPEKDRHSAAREGEAYILGYGSGARSAAPCAAVV